MAVEVGRVSVRATPNTRGFRDDLLKAVQKVEKQVKANISVIPVLDKARFQELRDRLNGLRGKATIETKLDSSALSSEVKAATERARAQAGPIAQKMRLDDSALRSSLAQARAAAERAEMHIPATVEGDKLRQSMQRAVRVIEAQTKNVRVPVDADESAQFRAKVARMVDYVRRQSATVKADADTREAEKKLNKLKDDMSMTLNADADTGKASMKLAFLYRVREASIVPVVNGGAFAAAKTALMALSGGNVLGDMGRSFKTLATDLDRVALKASTTGLALAGLGAAATAGTSNIFALGASLVSIAPAALALPGMFVGAGVGVATMILALKDAGKVLGDLKPQFENLQSSISSSFWDQAAQPIRNMATSLLPQLTTQMSGTATQIGSLFSSLAGAIQSSLGGGVLASLFEPLNQSISIAAKGMEPLVQGLVNLGRVGGQFLPGLASGFVDVANSFKEWSATADISGAVQAGLTALKDLWTVGGQVVGILSAVARAASEAGGSGLHELGEGLRQINDALSGPAGQGALVTVFSGAHAAMGNLGPAVDALAQSFVSLAPTISTVMQSATASISLLVQGLAQALQNPVFQAGLTAMFAGIQQGVAALAPSLGSLGTMFGTIATVIGTVAATLGPVLGTVIQAVTPLFVALGTAVQALVPVIGQALVVAIQAIAPVLQTVVTAISGFVAQFPGVSAAIIGVVAVLAGLVAAFAPVIGAIVSVVTAIGGLIPVFTAVMSAIAPLSVLLAAMGTSLAAVAASALVVPAIIAAVVAVFVLLYTTSQQFAEAVNGVVTAIGGLLAPILAAIIPPLMMVGQAFMSMVTTIGAALMPVLTLVIQIFGQLIANLTPFVSFIMSVLAPVFTFLASVVTTAFGVIQGIVVAAIGVVQAILQTFLALLQGNWAGVWNGLGAIVRAVWALIGSIVGGAVQMVIAVVTGFGSMLAGIWNAIWNGIVSYVTGVWRTITSVISGAGTAILGVVTSSFNSVMSFINGVMRSIGSFISGIWESIKTIFSNALSSVVSFVTTGFNNAKEEAAREVRNMADTVGRGIDSVVNFFKGLPGKITGVFSGAGEMLSGIGRNIVEGLVNGIKGAANSVMDAARDLVDKIPGPIKKAMGINSPSRVMRDEVGRWIPAGLAEGIEGNTSSVTSAMKSMAKEATKAGSAIDVQADMASRVVPDVGKMDFSDSSTFTAQANGSFADQVAAALQGVTFQFDTGFGVATARAVKRGERELARA